MSWDAPQLRGSLLVAGCYERFLFGLDTGPYDAPALKKVFTLEAHMSAVKCVTGAGGYIASGGADDLVRLFDTRRGVTDLGFLAHHEGSVTCLAFHPVSPSGAAPSHLLSGGADGGLCVWAAGTRWDKLKALSAHRGGVTALAVHPSGLLALSCGRDRGLRLWDLVKGRCTYKTRMAADGDALAFSPDGASYRVVCGADVALFDVASGELTATLHAGSRVLALAGGAAGGALLTAGEKGALAAWDARTGGRIAELQEASGGRIRGAVVPWGAEHPAEGPAAAPPGHDALPRLVATASSDGVVRLWDMRRAGPQAQPLCAVPTRARLTCLMAAPPGGAGAEPRAGGAAIGAGGAVPAAAAAQQRKGGSAVVAAPAARRVAVDAAPQRGGVHGSRLDRRDGAWWEAGERGPKLSSQYDKLRQERAEAERAARGINIRELKAAKKAAGEGEGGGGGRGGRGSDRFEGGRGGDGGGRGGRGKRDRGDGGDDEEERPRKGGPGRGGGGQGAKSGQRMRDAKHGGGASFGGSFKSGGGGRGGGRGGKGGGKGGRF